MPTRICCVDACPCTARNCILSVFPQGEKLRKIWVDLLSPHSQCLTTKTYISNKICMHHFEPKYLDTDKNGRKKRKVIAIPTLFTEKEIKRKKPDVPLQMNFVRKDIITSQSSKIQKSSSDNNTVCEEVPTSNNKISKTLGYIQHDHCYGSKQELEIISLEPDNIKNNESQIEEDSADSQPDEDYIEQYKPIQKEIPKYKSNIKKLEAPIIKDVIDHEEHTTKIDVDNNPILNKTNLAVPQFIEAYNALKYFDQSGALEFEDDIQFFDDFNARDVNKEVTSFVVDTSPDQPKTKEDNLVLHHQGFLKDKLRSVLHSHIFCAVCFESNKTFKSLDEELIIICDNWTQTILLKHVYTYVFKQTETSASGYICTECTTQLQQAYIFIKYSQLTSSLLNEYIDDAQSKIGSVHNLNKEGEKTHNKTIIILKSNEVNKYLVDQKDAIERVMPACPSDNHSACECKGGSKCYKCKNIINNTLRDEGIDNTEPYQYDKQNYYSAVNSQLMAYKKTKQSLLKKQFKTPIIKKNFKIKETAKEKETEESTVTIPSQEQNISECKIDFECDNITNNSFWDEGIQCNELYKSEIQIQNELISMNTQLRDIIKRHLKRKPKRSPKTKKMCEFCSKVYCNLFFHYADVHLKVQCKVCTTVVDEDIIKSHLMKEHADDVYLCNICDNPFYTLRRIQIHARIMHDIHDTSTINWMDPPKRTSKSKAREISDQVNALCCPDCSETPCIHIKYLSTHLEQTLNHTFALAKCADCDFACRTRTALVRHANIEHLNHCPHICDQCGSQFYCKQTLKNHIKSFHQTKNVYVCKYCDEQFKSSDIVSNHETSCSSIEREYRCEHCTASFNTYELWQKHHKLRHKEVFPCQYCNKELLTEASRKRHIVNVHSSVRIPTKYTFVCDICQEEFISRSKLKEHIKDHGPNVRYQCKICDTEYDSLNKLKTHNYTLRHNMPSVACNICGKQIKQVLLEQHLEEHKLDAEVSCDVCERRFNNIARLRTHMDCHLNPRKKKKQNRTQLKCQSCDYITVAPTLLEMHINKEHLHIKPFPCHVCQKTFYGRNMLQIHMRIWHLPRKKCPCPVCGKEYHKIHIKRHIELHIGEKRYACSLCEEKFVTSHRRYIHVRRKHTEKSECCPLCPKKFIIKSHLRRHIIVVHWKDEGNDANKFDPREVEGLENHYHLFPRWLENQN